MSLNFCPKCGAKIIKQKNKFCSFCGAELIDLAETKWKKIKDLVASSSIVLLSEIGTILNVDKSILAKKFENKKIEKITLEQNFIKIESGSNPILIANFFDDTVRICPKCNKRATGKVLKFCMDCGIPLLPKESIEEKYEKISLPPELEPPKVTVDEPKPEKEMSKLELLTNCFSILQEGIVNITELANILKIQRLDLMRKLLDLRTQVEFTLDGDYIKINPNEGENLKNLLKSSYL